MISCVACGMPLGPKIATLPYHLPGKTIETPVFRCRDCGSYVRKLDFSDPEIESHFSVSSYTDPALEAEWQHRRAGFFDYVLNLLNRHWGRPWTGLAALDVGCAYGHLLVKLRERGTQAEGVEPTEPLRTIVKALGYTCHPAIQAVPAARRFDVICAIDSLYYMPEPADELARLRSLLAEGGILLLRVAHRTWYLDLRRRFGLPLRAADFGDVHVNFSRRGIRRLLSRTGFDVERIYARESGRRDIGWFMTLYYPISGWLAAVGLQITPGLIVLARPSKAL